MKEFKGYPAPWDMRIDDGVAIFDWYPSSKESGAHTHFAECVVSMICSQEDAQDFLLANAVLMMASPDLLAALQQLLEIYDDQSGKVWTTSSERRALDNARAAVNKALGETK